MARDSRPCSLSIGGTTVSVKNKTTRGTGKNNKKWKKIGKFLCGAQISFVLPGVIYFQWAIVFRLAIVVVVAQRPGETVIMIFTRVCECLDDKGKGGATVFCVPVRASFSGDLVLCSLAHI
jgi:hypothetical protein